MVTCPLALKLRLLNLPTPGTARRAFPFVFMLQNLCDMSFPDWTCELTVFSCSISVHTEEPSPPNSQLSRPQRALCNVNGQACLLSFCPAQYPTAGKLQIKSHRGLHKL